jgi:hypothetical protein
MSEMGQFPPFDPLRSDVPERFKDRLNKLMKQKPPQALPTR